MSKGKIAFIGSGMIGTGLAINFLTHGYDTALQTRRQVDLARQRIKEMLATLVENNVISQKESDEAFTRCTITTSIEDAATGACFVQEAGPENVDSKRELISEIEKYIDADVPIASASSAFIPSQLQEGAQHPERILVGHPYLPAYIIPLVEMCGSDVTSLKAIEKAKAFYTDAGKEVIVARKEKSGCIVNRLSWAANAEAKKTVTEGICTVEEIDKAIMYGPGLRMAVLGQITTIGIGMGEDGYFNASKKYGIAMTPEAEMIALGYQAALVARNPDTGNDYASVSAWRDKMLIEILRLENKL